MFKAAVLLVFLACAGCQLPERSDARPFNLTLEPAFPDLRFEQPVDLQHAPDGSGRLFVVEQKGIIRVFPNDPQAQKADIFLDLTSEVLLGHMEEGMLGLAFHPRFKENGYFFVYYIADNPRRSRLARFQAQDNRADPASKYVVLEVPQPYGNHNGGQIAFGPDGYLYIALGDGGSGGDPHGHGQNPATLLGSILRIDVDHASAGKNYAIPPDNPFAGNKQGYREEIFAFGLRNPWRFSFDPKTQWLWAGDVGQDKPYEEIDIIEKGKNYGWNIMEGFHCYEPKENCDTNGLTLPVWEYTLDDGGRSVTGGHVYRGKKISELEGYYLYADFVSGRVWALKYDGRHPPENHLLVHNPNLYPSSFGVDENREIFICSFDGSIYRFK